MFDKATSLLGLWSENSSGIILEIGQGRPVALIGDLKTLDINRELILNSEPHKLVSKLSKDFQNPPLIMREVINESYNNFPDFTNGVAALAVMSNIDERRTNQINPKQKNKSVNKTKITNLEKDIQSQQQNVENKTSKNKKCWNCHKEESIELKLSKCGGCKKAKYCGQVCQKQDWDRHRDQCQKIKRRKEID